MKSEDLAKLAYENAGREISQSFEIQNSNMALAAGALAALVTVLGTGNLFTKDAVAGVPKLTTTSLLLLTIALPLLFRFYLRSLIAYQQLIRFNNLQSCAWKFLTGEVPETAFLKHYEVFILSWRSPRTFRNLVWENLKYGYFWIFTVAVAVYVWAFYSTSWCKGRLVSLALLIIAGLWERATLRATIDRYIRVPTPDEKRELVQANTAHATEPKN